MDDGTRIDLVTYIVRIGTHRYPTLPTYLHTYNTVAIAFSFPLLLPPRELFRGVAATWKPRRLSRDLSRSMRRKSG